MAMGWKIIMARKKVLVAGGGSGRLYAAYTAARQGYQVILCEKESEVGGILKNKQILPFEVGKECRSIA